MASKDTLISALLTQYSLISDQVTKPEVEVILSAIQSAHESGVPGAVVELGCYSGTTSLFIRRLLQKSGMDRPYHVYDSFQGLPEKTAADASPAGFAFQAGELAATKAGFILNFKKAGLPLPVIHKGWFEDLGPADMPHPIAVAFLDGDYYSSIAASLAVIEPHMAKNGTIIIDDYLSTTLPGAQKATDAWLARTQHTCSVREGMAVIKF